MRKDKCDRCQHLKKDKVVSFKDRPEKLTKAQDLYDLYNGFLLDYNSGAVAMSPEELEVVEKIRDDYQEVWDKCIEAEHYSIYEFETEALAILEGDEL